jgi:Secretion system C-terminal sorting domain
MKKIIITISFFVCFIAGVRSQCVSDNPNAPCCNGIISTDPSSPINAERNDLLNKFNWMQTDWNGFNPFAQSYYTRDNPYYSKDKYLSHLNYYNYSLLNQTVDKLDFQPGDGWELLHRNFGYEPNEVTTASSLNKHAFPYFILYNKYNGYLRFLGSKPRLGNPQNTLTTLGLRKNSALRSTGLFSNNGTYTKTLDLEGHPQFLSSISNYPANNGFFVADFPSLSYDPCVCNNSSELQFDFSTLTSANLVMNGRLIGTNVPLDGSGNSPLLNRDSFLLAVTNDQNFNVKGGMRTYNSINSLVKKYKTPATDPIEGILKGLIGSALKAGDKAIGGVISTGLTSFIKAVSPSPADTSFRKLILGKEGKLGDIGLGLLASNANHINSFFGIEEEKKMPNIGFIEAEMVLSGQMTSTTPDNDGSITLVTPGSLNSNNQSLQWSNVPAYNEALGVVAILNKAEAFRGYEIHDNNMPEQPDLFDSEHLFALKLKKRPEFYYNPALDVDIEKTKVYAAFNVKFDGNRLVSMPQIPSKFGDFNLVLDRGSNADYSYTTDFLPMECFENLRAGFDIYAKNGLFVNMQKKVELKLIFFMKYKKNKQGKEVSNMIEMTLPLDITDSDIASNQSNIPRMGRYPAFTILSSANNNLVYTQNTTIQAWNIFIDGNIVLAPGVTITLIAADNVDIAAGANIPNGVTIITGQKPNECAALPTRPVSAQFVKDFCASNKYKAKVFELLARNDSTKAESKNVRINKSFDFTISPNPFTNQITIDLNIEEATSANLDLSNAVGQTLKSMKLGIKEKGSYQETIETNDLAPGIYFLTLRTQNGTETKKIVKQ